MDRCKGISGRAIEGVIRTEIQQIIIGRYMKLMGLASDKELSVEQLGYAVDRAYCHLIGLLPLLAVGDMDDVILGQSFQGQDIEGQRHSLALPRWLFKTDAEYKETLRPGGESTPYFDKPLDVCELPYWLIQLIDEHRPK